MGRQSGWFARCPTTVFCRLANVVAIPLAVLQGMGRDESIALGVLTTTSLFIKPQVRKSVGMGSAGWTTTQENPMSNKPVPPNGFTLTEECEACPECSYKGCAKIGQQQLRPPMAAHTTFAARAHQARNSEWDGPNPARQLHPMEILKILEQVSIPPVAGGDSSPCSRCERTFVARTWPLLVEL